MMAKKKSESAEEPPKRRQVNIDEDLYRWAGQLANHEGMTLPSYVNSILRPVMRAKMRAYLKSINEEFADLLDEK